MEDVGGSVLDALIILVNLKKSILIPTPPANDPVSEVHNQY